MEERFDNIDLVRTVIMTGTFLSGLMAISFGGVVYAWSSARTIAPFCVAGILFIIFGFSKSVHRDSTGVSHVSSPFHKEQRARSVVSC